ncbi:MAG: hypothetical protein ACOH5I_18985 [Oligoflexus sp.]
MVIDFAKMKARRDEKLAYRQNLINRIVAHYQETNHEMLDSFYMEHVRHGFPIHVLEEIAERLDQSKVS